MSTVTITNPADWQAGDHATITFEDGAVLTGLLRDTPWAGLCLGRLTVRGADCTDITNLPVVVTREVPVLVEPLGLGAVVEVDGSRWVRAGTVGCPWWRADDSTLTTWTSLLSRGDITVLNEGVL
jgi:hypothetical protein